MLESELLACRFRDEETRVERSRPVILTNMQWAMVPARGRWNAEQTSVHKVVEIADTSGITKRTFWPVLESRCEGT